MANFIHYSNVNSLFKKKNEQVWRSRNQAKLASPTPITTLVKPKRHFSVKAIISAIILGLLIVGGVSAMVLSQMQQDVRQRASGCVYWNGQAATEGSYDNRGGIRQQCVNGYWDRPDDGNLDPSQIVAAQNANKPKLGCVNWSGENVSHGAYDNRGGIRQQCVNGLWDVPDDGNTNPSGMPQPVRDMRGCVNWSGENVSHGTYDVRGDIRQQCLDGLWDTPDDRITDPNDTVSLAVVGVTNDLAAGDIEYIDARTVYDQYCRTGNIDPSDAERCQSLGRLLTQEEQMIRYSALEERVQSNTDQVSFAIGGLDDRSMDYAGASEVYQTYCQGANAQQTSSSVCKSLRSELDEIAAQRAAAETARYTALNESVQSNTNQVTNALGGLADRSVDLGQAVTIYREYCEGAKAQQTSSSACKALDESIDEIQTLVSQSTLANAEGLNAIVVVNTASVNYAVNALDIGAMDVEAAQDTYDQYCVGSNFQLTSSSACRALESSIDEFQGADPDVEFQSSDPDALLVAETAGQACVPYTCVSGKYCDTYGIISDVSCLPAAETCQPNTCTSLNTWCGEDGRYMSLSCGTSTGCDEGRVAEGRCNSVGQRCVNGVLYSNSSCANEQPDINSIIADNVDAGCFSVCLDRGGSQQRCNEECEGFNPNLVNTSTGYQTLSQCITAMEIGGLSGRCIQSGNGRYVFEPASATIAAAEYKYCYWWSTSTGRCVENVYSNPTFDDCSSLSSGMGNSCGEVTPLGVNDNPEEMKTDQEIIQDALDSAWSYISSLPQQFSYNNSETEIVAYYDQLNEADCQCHGSFENEAVTVDVGVSGTGNDGKCYQCYINPNGSCGWSTSCGYNMVTTVNSDLDQEFVELQLDNPNNLFMVSNLTTEDQVIPLQITFDLLPDSLTSSEQITYLVGDADSGGGLANQGSNIVYLGSPGDLPYTQNPDVAYGYAISIITHETLHILEDTELEGFCPTTGCPTYLDRFVEVAAADGLVFETEFSDMEVTGTNDFMLYTEYPTNPTEGFAITGAAYVLSPDQLREERPELYAFYRDSVFNGVEYIEVRNADCTSSHIEVRSEESIQAQQQMNDQCN